MLLGPHLICRRARFFQMKVTFTSDFCDWISDDPSVLSSDYIRLPSYAFNKSVPSISLKSVFMDSPSLYSLIKPFYIVGAAHFLNYALLLGIGTMVIRLFSLLIHQTVFISATILRSGLVLALPLSY